VSPPLIRFDAVAAGCPGRSHVEDEDHDHSHAVQQPRTAGIPISPISAA
jgi:hypothetical protein